MNVKNRPLLFFSAITVTIVALIFINADQWAAVLILLLTLLLSFYIIRKVVDFLNDKIIHQYLLLNQQLNLELLIPPRRWYDLRWRYPSIRGTYLNRHLIIKVDDKKPMAHTRITIDVFHYGRTFFIRKNDWMTWLKSFFKSKSIKTQNGAFNRYFLIESTDPRFILQLLDEPIIELMNEDIVLKNGVFKLEHGQVIFEEQYLIKNEDERDHTEKIILLLYMMAKRIDYMREKYEKHLVHTQKV